MRWQLFDNATDDTRSNDITKTTICPLHHLLMTLLLHLLALESVSVAQYYEEATNKSIMEPLYLPVDLNLTQRLIYHNSKKGYMLELNEFEELEKLNMPNTPV